MGDLYLVYFKPEEQESELAGGQGREEVIVSLKKLVKQEQKL